MSEFKPIPRDLLVSLEHQANEADRLVRSGAEWLHPQAHHLRRAFDPGNLLRLLAEVRQARERRRDYLAAALGVPPGEECRTCGGLGRRTYGSTSTWRGGPGGQTITGDVCDKCWGTGSRTRSGPNLRRIVRTTRGDA